MCIRKLLKQKNDISIYISETTGCFSVKKILLPVAGCSFSLLRMKCNPVSFRVEEISHIADFRTYLRFIHQCFPALALNFFGAQD